MIRNDQEYKVAVEKLSEEEQTLKAHKKQLAKEGLTPAQVKRAMAPLQSFALQLKEEVEYYEKLKQGVFPELSNFSGLGQLLVALRIAKNISQTELAEALGVNKSAVSRDEKNEYHGVTVERANRVLEALGANLVTHVEDISLNSNRLRKSSEVVPA